jgi:hypothetical protein
MDRQKVEAGADDLVAALVLCAVGAGRYSLDGLCIREIPDLFQQQRQ